jgi:hypothetical protein
MLAGQQLGFYTILNDFWGLFHLGEHLTVSDPRTLQNGFYPPGYPLLLRVLLGRQILVTTFLLSVACASAALWLVYRWLAPTTGAAQAGFATGVLAVHPMFFQHAITAGPDMPTLLLGLAGVLWLWDALEKGRIGRAAFAGLLLGLSGLTRHHGFLLAAGATLAGLACWPRQWRPLAAAAAVVGACGFTLVGINVAAGVPPFQTAQAFNVYKMFNPVDWFHLQRNYPENVFEVIRLSPARYWDAYTAQLTPSLILLLPSLTAVIVAAGRARRLAVFMLITAAIYLPLQATGGSPRGPLPAVPLAAVSLAIVLHALETRLAMFTVARRLTLSIGTMALVLGAVVWVPQNRGLVASYAGMKDLWLSVETALRNDGVQYPAQVFTDSFDFYFVSVRSARSWDYRARNTGGWAQIDLYGYDRVHPPLRTTSLEEFLADAHAYGVTHLVLTSTAGYVLGALGEMQAGGALPDGMRHVADLPGVRIVALGTAR